MKISTSILTATSTASWLWRFVPPRRPRASADADRRLQNPGARCVWHLSPLWRRYELVRIASSTNPDLTNEATVTRKILVPDGMRTQRYVGGIGYVEDLGDYGFEPASSTPSSGLPRIASARRRGDRQR